MHHAQDTPTTKVTRPTHPARRVSSPAHPARPPATGTCSNCYKITAGEREGHAPLAVGRFELGAAVAAAATDGTGDHDWTGCGRGRIGGAGTSGVAAEFGSKLCGGAGAFGGGGGREAFVVAVVGGMKHGEGRDEWGVVIIIL